MAQLFANAARAPLFSPIDGTATTLEVLQDGGLFPAVVAPDWFRAVLQDADGIEVMRVTAHGAGSNIFTVERGQEGTIARAFAAGSTFGLRMTAGDLQNFLSVAANMVSLTGDQTVAGVKTFAEQIIGATSTQVSLTGNQTIAGVKTFSSSPLVPDGATANSAASVGQVSAAMPAGAVIYVAMNTPPAGYLKANGQAVSRTLYPALFSAIGTFYGAGDGSTTFNLPDLRGEFLRGWDDGRGADPNRSFGSFQNQDWKGFEMTNTRQNSMDYSHGPVYMGKNVAPADFVGNMFTGSWAAPAAAIGARWDASEIRPRNVSLLACIKT